MKRILRHNDKWRSLLLPSCNFAEIWTDYMLCSLYCNVRSYYYPYADDFVPKDAQTSAFQSSSIPSKRSQILKSYAFSPLFASRTPCCVLGFNECAKALVSLKPQIRSVIAEIFDCEEEDIELGSIRQMKDMLLHRCNTDNSPRFADDTYSGPRLNDKEKYVKTRYARLPVQARSLIDVYFESKETSSVYNCNDTSSDTIISYGLELQALHYAVSLASRGMQSIKFSHGNVTNLTILDNSQKEKAISNCNISKYYEKQCENESEFISEQENGDGTNKNVTIERNEVAEVTSDVNGSGTISNVNIVNLNDKVEGVVRSRAVEGVAKLYALGVIYCEVPRVDESGFLFDQFLGEEVDESNTESILRSWERVSQKE